MGVRVLILGGDRRMVSAANAFLRDGFEVLSYGFSEGVEFEGEVIRCGSVDDGADGADVIVGGLPLTSDGKTLHTPLWNDTLTLADVISAMGENKYFFGGKIPLEMRSALDSAGILWADYLDREELAVANAVPTAEGAIAVAMDALPVTLWKSKALVVGNGRIGKVLSHRLNGLGADTYVSARKFVDLSWIDAYGYKSVTYDKLREHLPLFDVIFNTVPKLILGGEELALVRENCIVVDLASAPGGVDTEYAGRLGIRVIPALALPGRCAPDTAGEIIEGTILNILSEMRGI